MQRRTVAIIRNTRKEETRATAMALENEMRPSAAESLSGSGGGNDGGTNEELGLSTVNESSPGVSKMSPMLPRCGAFVISLTCIDSTMASFLRKFFVSKRSLFLMNELNPSCLKSPPSVGLSHKVPSP